MKYFVILCLVTFTTIVSGNRLCLGCMRERKGADLKISEELLNKSLTKLAAGDGPYYQLIKINYATTQEVGGNKDVISADLKDQQENIKTCKIEIFSKCWLTSDNSVTVDCPGESKLVKTYKP